MKAFFFLRNSALILATAALPLAAAQAQSANAQNAAVPQFQNGDVVAFVGDSITHSRKYHSYVYDYYLTRFPQRKIRFVNNGISGDSAGGALRRLDWDVLPQRPNVISLMLGMNDVNRGLYGKTTPDEGNLKAREQALSGYRANMTKLVETLTEKLHPRFVFVKPSPYDQTVQVETENLFGVNEALAQCGLYGEELAKRSGGGVVDFHGPMTQMNLEGQKADPKFTLIGSDRVHPGDVGQLVMAYLYLKAQQLPAVVCDFAVDAATQKATRSVNGELSNVKFAGGTLTFESRENALPFPVEDGARGALSLVPLEAELNQQRLAVNLPGAGNYRLSVDGQAVGDFAAEQLRAGVNLAFNSKMPQFQQAQKVRALNEKRRGQEARLRSFAQVKIMLINAKIDATSDEAVAAYFADFLAKLKSNQPYFKSQFENYSKTKPELENIKAEIETMTTQLWQINQPTPHRYELAPVVL